MSIGDDSFEHEVGRGVGNGGRRSLANSETAAPLSARQSGARRLTWLNRNGSLPGLTYRKSLMKKLARPRSRLGR